MQCRYQGFVPWQWCCTKSRILRKDRQKQLIVFSEVVLPMSLQRTSVCPLRGASQGVKSSHTTTVNGQPCMPIGQPVSGNAIPISYMHVKQHCANWMQKKSGSIGFLKSSSTATTSYEGRPFKRQNFVMVLPQQYIERLIHLCPYGCQTIICLIQRCPANVAKCSANRFLS